MADVSKIEWTDSTINLWIGCTRVSAACDNCYAALLGRRFGVQWDGPPKRTGEASWGKIAAYQRGAARFIAKHGRPRRVFINSLSDFFDNQAEAAWRAAACVEMEAAPDVIFILVTKRPMLVGRMVPAHWMKREGWPKNVWLLTTAENQEEYDRRVAHLLTVPGAVIGISGEPLLDDIMPSLSLSYSPRERAAWASRIIKRPVDPDRVNRLQWAIIGGESGRKARPMPPQLQIQRLIGTFDAAEVPVFFKQLSQREYTTTFKDFATFPPGFQIRRHPA